MVREQKHKSGGDFGLLLLLLSAFLVVVAYLWPRSPAVGPGDETLKIGSAEQNSVKPPAQAVVPPAVVKRINEDLKETAIKEEMLRQNRQLDVQSAPPLGAIDEDAVRMDEIKDSTNPLVLEQENGAAKAIQDTRGNPRLPPTSDQRINSQLAKEQWAHEYDQKYQEEYVRQFIQNAHKNGYDIKVNKDLDVTGITPSTVDQPLRFPQSEKPANSDSAK